MSTHLQMLDRKMCLTCQRHGTPVLLPGVQVSAAQSCQHTSQHLRWAQEQKLQHACETVLVCCTVVPSQVLWLQLHKQIPRSDLRDSH